MKNMIKSTFEKNQLKIHSWHEQADLYLKNIGFHNFYDFKVKNDNDNDINIDYYEKIIKKSYSDAIRVNLNDKKFNYFHEKIVIDLGKRDDFIRIQVSVNIEESESSRFKKFKSELEDNKLIEKSYFYTLGADSFGLKLEKNDIKKFKIDVKLNYGEKFIKHDNKIKNLLKGTHGLFLFHGKPGCGKTMYIRHLIEYCSKNLKDKKIIYVPSYMISKFTDPEFFSFIRNYKNIILIIEDAEYCLKKRTSNMNSEAVSNILNLTSGLLNDLTKCQIISTFNIDLSEIDEALLRQGRLNYKYEFNKLEPKEVIELAKNLKISDKIEKNTSMNLSEIYNISSFKNDNKKQSVGFKFSGGNNDNDEKIKKPAFPTPPNKEK